MSQGDSTTKEGGEDLLAEFPSLNKAKKNQEHHTGGWGWGIDIFRPQFPCLAEAGNLD